MADNCFLKKISTIYDSHEQLRHHILWLLMLRVVLFTLLLVITTLLQSKGNEVILPPLAVIQAFLSVVFIHSIGSAALLQNAHINLRRFGAVQLLSDTFFAALLVYGTGCSQSIFTSIFIFPVISGGLILYRIGGLIPAASSTLLYAVVLYLEYLGRIPYFYKFTSYVPPQSSLALTNIFAVYGVTFFVMALLSSKLAAKLRSTEKALTKTSLEYDRLSQLYKQIFDDIATGIVTIDASNIITSCNYAVEKITGFSRQDLINQPFDTFFPEVNLQETMHDRPVADLTQQDGTTIRIGYSSSQLNLPQGPVEDQNSTGGMPEADNSRIITMQDISKVEQMERKVRNAEKMAAIGELSAAVAHDFRNPLAAISGSAQILSMELADSEAAGSTNQSLADIILRESNRMAKTITEFLQFARPTTVTPEWFNLRRMVGETVEQLTSQNAPNQQCTIQNTIPDQLDCWADRQQLQTICMHLLENSCVASKQTTRPITITANEQEKTGKNVLCIQITDHGPGIDKKILDKIFTPFFSTRAESTGLGLSIVRQLLEQHHTKLTLTNIPEGGCQAEICLTHPEPPKNDGPPVSP